MNDLSDEACLAWGTEMYGIIRAEEGLIFWQEFRRRAEAEIKELEWDLKGRSESSKQWMKAYQDLKAQMEERERKAFEAGFMVMIRIVNYGERLWSSRAYEESVKYKEQQK